MWTAPVTFVSNAVLTAAQLNAAIRDNMNETAPAKAQHASGYFTSNAANSISERLIESALAKYSLSVTSSSYVSSPATGPEVEVTHSGTILALWSTRLHVGANIGPTNVAACAAEVAGQTSASDLWAIKHPGAVEDLFRAESSWLFTGLTPGTDTVRLMYKVVGGGPAVFYQRELIVMPF